MWNCLKLRRYTMDLLQLVNSSGVHMEADWKRSHRAISTRTKTLMRKPLRAFAVVVAYIPSQE